MDGSRYHCTLQSLIYSCSQQLSQAEDSLPRTVLEVLGFALGKRTVIFAARSQTVCYKQPPAGTTSSKPAPCYPGLSHPLGSREAADLLEALPPPITLPASASLSSPHQASVRNSSRKTAA